MDDDMPRRRRGARAAAIEAAEERGFLLRMFLHSPKDMIAGLLAAAAVSAIIANAVFLQAGRHPSPMFGAAPRRRNRSPIRCRARARSRRRAASSRRRRATPRRPNPGRRAKPADAM